MTHVYRHLGIGSTAQLTDFINNRLHELRELISNSEAEREMWQFLDMRPGIPAIAHGHLRKRNNILSERIYKDQNEEKMLVQLLESLDVCDICKGLGYTTFINECDDVRHHTCALCNGKGSVKE